MTKGEIDMPICTNCHHPWTRGELWKASLTLKQSMTCPHCGAEQFQTKESRKKGSLLLLIIPLGMLISFVANGLGWGWWSLILYLAVVVAVYVYFFPKTVRLTDTEEPLW